MKNATQFENPPAEGYRDLLVWQKGIELSKLTYALTRPFPADEKFGLVSQMRRTTGEFIHFISQAEGSVAELSTQHHRAVELGFLSDDAGAPARTLLDELRRMLNGLRRKLGEAG
jgi:hypothetical protein